MNEFPYLIAYRKRGGLSQRTWRAVKVGLIQKNTVPSDCDPAGSYWYHNITASVTEDRSVKTSALAPDTSKQIESLPPEKRTP